MKLRMWAAAFACVCGVGWVPLHAQTSQPLDYIVALVNSEPITYQELQRAIQQTTDQLTQQGKKVPSPAELRSTVLEDLIGKRAQLQVASETGIKIDAAAVDREEQALAAQNGVDVPTFYARMAKNGVTAADFRNKLKDQLTLDRLRERDVESGVRVSDVDLDRAMQEQLAANSDPLTFDINLAQILLAVPEKATAAQVAAIEADAKRLRERIRNGESFEKLVQTDSAASHSNAGQLGLRRADRYPLLFVQATQALKVGDVSEVVRSGAGFHILKVVEKRAPTTLVQFTAQTHARHILLRLGPQLTQRQAISKLADLRQQIVAGKTDFASAARRVSQDTSADQGGDLGWVSPGMFVPEFDTAMNALKEDEISTPVVSRFGVHLIQVLERRSVELSPQQVREAVRSQVRSRRSAEAYRTWAQDIRARAYVEMREPPQ